MDWFTGLPYLLPANPHHFQCHGPSVPQLRLVLQCSIFSSSFFARTRSPSHSPSLSSSLAHSYAANLHLTPFPGHLIHTPHFPHVQSSLTSLTVCPVRKPFLFSRHACHILYGSKTPSPIVCCAAPMVFLLLPSPLLLPCPVRPHYPRQSTHQAATNQETMLKETTSPPPPPRPPPPLQARPPPPGTKPWRYSPQQIPISSPVNQSSEPQHRKDN